MVELFSRLPGVATILYAVSSMLSVGLSYTTKEIVVPLRNGWAVARALLANFVLVPLAGLAIIWLLALEQALGIGLILGATAAGAPFLIKLTVVAGRSADVGLGATLLVLLLPVTILYMPLVVPLLVPGASVSALAIAVPLVLSMLLPLALGLLVKEMAPRHAERFQPIMAKTAGYALVALIGLTVLVNLQVILDVTMRAVVAALLLVVAAFLVGYPLGGRDARARVVLGLGSGQRNIAAGTVVATQSFTNPDVLVMVIVTALVGLGVLFPIASQLRQREIEASKPEPGGLPQPVPA